MLTQDSINQAIKEVNVRIGCVDGIEKIPKKRMSEADCPKSHREERDPKLATEGRRRRRVGSVHSLLRSSWHGVVHKLRFAEVIS